MKQNRFEDLGGRQYQFVPAGMMGTVIGLTTALSGRYSAVAVYWDYRAIHNVGADDGPQGFAIIGGSKDDTVPLDQIEFVEVIAAGGDR